MEAIDNANDESLVLAIARLLHLEEEQIPNWHKNTLQERIAKYEKEDSKMKDCNEVQKKL